MDLEEKVKIIGIVIFVDEGIFLIGVFILVKGISFGMIMDLDGKYLFDFEDENVVLVFFYMGYVFLEVFVDGCFVVDVVLEVSVIFLDEVVVVGYGL